MEKNNIIFLFGTFTDYKSGKLTGAHRRYIELINGLARENVVEVYSRGIDQIGHSANIHQHIYSIPRWARYLPNHIASIVCLRRAIKQDCIRHYDYAVAFGAANVVCFWFSGIKRITALFREDLIEYRKAINTPKLKLQYYKVLEHFAAKRADRIIVQCSNDKNNLIERNKKIKDIEHKVFVQINNANASWMNYLGNEYENSESTEDVKILFVGHFSNSRKGHAILLPAIKRLVDEGYNITLLIAGDGKELGKYMKEYAAYTNIKFLNRVDNMKKLFSAATFEIVPSLIDSCPNTVLEGLRAGVPVYGSNSGGIPDLLVDKEFMFEPSIEGIYKFTKEVIDTKRFISDEIKQKERLKELCFDWPNSIEKIIRM